jgi:hypothetical protein
MPEPPFSESLADVALSVELANEHHIWHFLFLQILKVGVVDIAIRQAVTRILNCIDKLTKENTISKPGEQIPPGHKC